MLLTFFKQASIFVFVYFAKLQPAIERGLLEDLKIFSHTYYIFTYAIDICGDGTLRGDRISRSVIHGSVFISDKTDGATYVKPLAKENYICCRQG
jgi:hypothetical protein